MPKRNTTGSLRAVLLKTLDDVTSGRMDPQQASAVVKIAAQINMSLLTEAQIGRINVLANRPVHSLGEMPIETEADAPVVVIEQTKTVPPKTGRDIAAVIGSGGRVIDRRPTGAVDFGDPPPGRSALDQRRQADGT